MGKALEVGSKMMIPPLMPCERCYDRVHYPENANKCLTPVYYGRYLGFDKPPHLWGGFAEYVYVDLEMLPGTKIYKSPVREDKELLESLAGQGGELILWVSPVWTMKNRGRYDRSKLRYPSDLSDEEWALTGPLIPPAKRGGNRRTVSVREVVNGLMYVF